MTYRDRREARADRLREWADKREAKADADLTRAREMTDVIPFGQPILVGHYSEGRDRRYRDRAFNTMGRGVEHARKAEEMRRKADSIDRAADHAVYSDDHDAAERLEARIAEREAERDRIKTYNASARKGSPDPSVLSDAQRRTLASLTATGMLKPNGSFPSFATTNLSAAIRKDRKRLESMT